MSNLEEILSQVVEIKKGQTPTSEIAKATVDELIDRLSDEATVEKIVNVWKGVLDKALGRGIRAVIVTIILFLAGVLSVRFDPLHWFR